MDRINFDIVLKIAERCNLACPYCYYYFQEYNPHARPALMTKEVEERLPEFLKCAIADLQISHLNIVFHGGEPLLFGKERFRNLCLSLKGALEYCKISHSFGIQTNGTLVDREWCDILIDYGINIGISIDGPKAAHDFSRPDHSGRGSFENACRGLRIAQRVSNERRAKTPGAIAVVHADADLPSVLDFLIGDLNIPSPNINFPRGGINNVDVQKFELNTQLTRQLTRAYLEKFVNPSFHFVRGLTDVLLPLFSDKGAIVNDKRASLRHFIVTIASDGALLVDDNLIAVCSDLADNSPTVFDMRLSEFVDTELFWKLTNVSDLVAPECHQCEWFRSCRSGHLFNRYSDGSFENKSSLCRTIQVMHEECASYLLRNGVISMTELSDRLSAPPTASSREAHRFLLGGE